MEQITAYLLSITAAAIICTVVKMIAGEKGPVGKIVKTVSGIFLAVTLLSAILQIEIDDFEQFFDEFSVSASENVQYGEEMARNAMSDIIIHKTQSYILEEAERLGLTLEVQILLNDSSPPAITGVLIRGEVAPYKKTLLSQYIAKNLGISQEKQQWI